MNRWRTWLAFTVIVTSCTMPLRTTVDPLPAPNLLLMRNASGVRKSSIGTTVATQAVLGALAGASAGLAIEPARDREAVAG
jgi:hypothetical protein